MTDALATDEAVSSKEAAMRAGGVPVNASMQEDYFGFSQTHKVMLPDGVSYIEHKTLTEGDRRAYLNEVQKDMRLNRATGDAFLKLAGGDERYILLTKAIIGWNLVRDGKPVPFGKGSPGAELEKWLAAANPKIIDLVEKDVRLRNPWLMQDISIEDIDKQISELQELRAKKVEEDEGKGTSPS